MSLICEFSQNFRSIVLERDKKLTMGDKLRRKVKERERERERVRTRIKSERRSFFLVSRFQ